jgi:TolB-like protein/class 3 adenylate cyclase/Tfp pilus assembly protein PilF
MMMAESKLELHLEIAHVLFIDVVGYSKLLINDQSEILEELNQIVRDTSQFREAEAAGKLIRLATGDGMALVFFNNVAAPVKCALEISEALQNYPQIPLRMGVHSGPINPISDVNDRSNVTGAGINMAQRVMDCGDAGHILLSRRVAEDLEQYRQWQPYLHDLGECEVKHGVRLHVFNLYTDKVGNRNVPTKLKFAARRDRRSKLRPIVVTIALLLLLGAAASFWLIAHRATKPVVSSNTSAMPPKSIAVLPFENLSEEKENAFFTDGVQNEILTDLAKIEDLKVISRTSVLIYKAGAARNLREIGQQLGVAHVLEGSVQRAGGKVRVNAQLIDARTDKHLWAKTYDRELADVFAIETEVAQAIANELQAKLSPGERALIEQIPTQNLAAYDLYVRAVPLVDGAAFSSTQDKDLLQAVDLLNQALALDPAFLLADCWLARAHDSIYFLKQIDHTPARLALAKSAIDAAFRLQANSGEAHLAMAWHLYWGYFDYDHARVEVDLAARTLPNNPIVYQLRGLMDRRQGRWTEAVRNLERASELDPRNENSLITLITTYEMVQDYDGQRKALDRWQLFRPNDLRLRLGRAEIERDQRADLRLWRDELQKVMAENPAAVAEFRGARFYLAMLERDFNTAASIAAEFPEKDVFDDGTQLGRDFYKGVVARLRGDAEAAKSALTSARLQQEQLVRAQPEDGQVLCGLAMIDGELKRKEEALSEGKKAVDLMAKYFFEQPEVIARFAIVCAQLGERDLAIEQLDLVANKPNGPTYGWLRLSPFLDPLRGDPRFEKMVASLAPKDATPK